MNQINGSMPSAPEKNRKHAKDFRFFFSSPSSSWWWWFVVDGFDSVSHKPRVSKPSSVFHLPTLLYVCVCVLSKAGLLPWREKEGLSLSFSVLCLSWDLGARKRQPKWKGWVKHGWWRWWWLWANRIHSYFELMRLNACQIGLGSSFSPRSGFYSWVNEWEEKSSSQMPGGSMRWVLISSHGTTSTTTRPPLQALLTHLKCPTKKTAKEGYEMW